jgi:hypothetical protein
LCSVNAPLTTATAPAEMSWSCHPVSFSGVQHNTRMFDVRVAVQRHVVPFTRAEDDVIGPLRRIVGDAGRQFEEFMLVQVTARKSVESKMGGDVGDPLRVPGRHTSGAA